MAHINQLPIQESKQKLKKKRRKTLIAAQHIFYWKLEALRLIDNKSFIVYKRFWFNAILYRQILSSWRLGTHCNFSVATEDDGSHTNDSSPAGIDLLTNLAHASLVSVMTFRA